MRVAIVHDYIKEYGGAERVLEALHEIWPTSPVFTSVYIPEFLGPHKERFKDWDIRTSFLQYIPFKEKLISPFRIIAPFVFKMFDFSQFDIVIVSATGAYIPNTIKLKAQISNLKSTTQNSKLGQRPKTKDKRPIHICYCHTPPRYLYGYATARNWKKSIILGSIRKIVSHFLRLIDFRSSQNVDYFITNSKTVVGRIKKFYRREAVVIYPPVDINSKFNPRFNRGQKSKLQVKSQNKGYYLAGGRLARPKHIDLIVGACRELNVLLKVFGRAFGGWEKDIGTESRHSGKRPKGAHPESQIIGDSGQARMTGADIEFVGEVSDEEKLELMRNARAYIFAAEDEDFGITPVEAMSVGTPVIAYRSGGVVESVVDGKTGIFFEELTVEGLKRTIQQFNPENQASPDNGAGNLTIKSSDCIKQAGKFSKERFRKEIKEFVESKLTRLIPAA